jgi:hypothetical protein
MEIIKIKEGSYKIDNLEIIFLRKKYRFYKNLLISLIILSALLGLVSIFVLFIDFNLVAILLIICTAPGVYFPLQKLPYYLELLDLKEIESVIIQVDSNFKLDKIYVRESISGKSDTVKEYEVRVNQSVGLKMVYCEDGMIRMEIIVDIMYPGIAIYTTYDLIEIADIIQIFKQIANKNYEYHHVDEEDQPILKEEIKEISELINQSTIMNELRS